MPDPDSPKMKHIFFPLSFFLAKEGKVTLFSAPPNKGKNKGFPEAKNYTVTSALSEIKPASGLSFNLLGQFGKSVDYQNSRKANALKLMPSAELGLGQHLNINLQHAFQRLTLKGSKIFEANLSQVRLVYNFSVRAFIRAIIQYLDVSRKTDLYIFPVQPKTRTVFTQFLFSYKLNPQTLFFIGYSDNYLGSTGIDITQTDRTFFIKLGYAWTK